MPDLLQVLTDRELVHDATPGLAERLSRGPITGYVGFDPRESRSASPGVASWTSSRSVRTCSRSGMAQD